MLHFPRVQEKLVVMNLNGYRDNKGFDEFHKAFENVIIRDDHKESARMCDQKNRDKASLYIRGLAEKISAWDRFGLFKSALFYIYGGFKIGGCLLLI